MIKSNWIEIQKINVFVVMIIKNLNK